MGDLRKRRRNRFKLEGERYNTYDDYLSEIENKAMPVVIEDEVRGRVGVLKKGLRPRAGR